MKTEIIIGISNDMSASAINAVRKAIKEFSPDAQVVHIIIASIIKTKKEWRTLIKVIEEPDKDIVPQKAITFCHLPYKYNYLYDDLLDEVDNINLINDESIWNNITAYLLDIIFYKAVHFKPLERVSGSKGGYLKETTKHDQQPEIDTLGIDFDVDKVQTQHHLNKLYDCSFYKQASDRAQQDKKTEDEFFYDRINGLTRQQKLLKTLKRSFD
jgi:hypothetical protein